MIEVTSEIVSRRAVDGPSAVELEHISCAVPLTPVGFFGRDDPATVGDDVGVARNRLDREQAEPSGRAADADGACRHCFALEHHPEKWKPVFRKDPAPMQKVHDPEKWKPVFRKDRVRRGRLRDADGAPRLRADQESRSVLASTRPVPLQALQVTRLPRSLTQPVPEHRTQVRCPTGAEPERGSRIETRFPKSI